MSSNNLNSLNSHRRKMAHTYRENLVSRFEERLSTTQSCEESRKAKSKTGFLF